METKRSTTEEEAVSTPASSPTSCEDRDDFVSLMDENGIIGLLEALEIVGAGEYRVNVERDHEGPSGLLTETQLDEVGYQRSHRTSPGEDAQILPPSPGGVFPEEALSDGNGASLSGSRCSDWSCQPSRTIQRRCPVAARSSASFRAASLKNTSSRPNSDSRNPTASTNNAALNKSSKSHLNGCTPDYSKVKPRVNFPKVSYKPPKSRLRYKGETLSSRPPIGAESIEEDSRDMPGAPRATPDTAGGCQVLRSPREATRLLSELEENYNKLWIKYAEAENTIDHLRLAAKVNLYSDGPKPGHSVQSVYNQEASKFMTLDFPQAQRAEASLISLTSDEQRIPQNPPVTKEPSVTLYTQASDFLQRLQKFEDLLKCQQLSPDEQRKELSQLFEGLCSLESSYLLAKDENKLLPKEEENRHFDPDRELEGLIFDCVLYMDELKEHAEQIQKDLLTREPSPSPARSSSPSEGRGNLTHPQKTRAPSLVYPPEREAATLNSVSDESNREEARKETASSLCLKTVNCSLGPSEEFYTLPDDHQNFREIPQDLALSQKKKALLPTASKTDMQAGGLEVDGPDQKIENQKVKESPQQRNLSPEDFAHRYNSAQLINQATIVDHSGRQERFEMRTSHGSSLSSLGEIAASEKRHSNLQAGSRSLPSQDGIVSPETDSGFNGMESCHPTPTQAPSPLHQGAMESVSVVQDRNLKNPHNGLVTSPDLFPLLPRCCPATELSTTAKFNTKQPRRTKPKKAQRRKTFTCAHQCWNKKSNSGTSDVESSRSTVSEDGQSGCYRESITSLSPSSSRSSRPCHGGCTKVRRSTGATDNSISMQMLQAEVSRLHHRLESCLKERERLASASETTVRENHHHPRTFAPRVSSRKVNTDVTAAVRKRPCCALEQGHRPDILGPQTQSAVSRCTQTVSTASENCSSRPNAVHTKHRSVSVQAPEMSNEPDAEDLSLHSSPCRRCISRQEACAENSLPANSKAATRSCCSHHRGSTDTDCHRFAHANTNTWYQAAETVKCCATAAPPPPPPLQYVCPLSLLLCSSPLCASLSNKKDTTTGLQSPNESKSRRKRSPSADGQNFLDRSLNKAIRAAKHMESTSGHMSRSLRSGLHHQQLLLTPLMAQLSQRQTSS